MSTKHTLASICTLTTTLLLAGCGTATTASTPAPTALHDGTYTQHQVSKTDSKIALDISATLAQGTITSLTVSASPSDTAGTAYTQKISGIAQQMTGKTIDAAKKLGYVSGASTASQAFSDALDAIAKQAAA